MKHPGRGSDGFTLLEVLIALVVLSFGLLGNASLQVNGLRSMYMAKMRTEVTYLAYDMADRIRANEVGARSGHYDGTVQAFSVDCVGLSNNCSALAMAQYDSNNWFTQLSTIPSGSAVIANDGADGFTATVRWDEERKGVTGTNCPPVSEDDLRCFVLEISL